VMSTFPPSSCRTVQIGGCDPDPTRGLAQLFGQVVVVVVLVVVVVVLMGQRTPLVSEVFFGCRPPHRVDDVARDHCLVAGCRGERDAPGHPRRVCPAARFPMLFGKPWASSNSCTSDRNSWRWSPGCCSS